MAKSIRYVVRPKRNPQDKGTPSKYYAVVASRGTTTTRELAEVISSATTLQLPDVVAVLAALQMVVCEELAKGNTVSLGSLGYLKLTMKSKGALTGKDYRLSDCLKGVNCRFITSKYLKLTAEATFTKKRSSVYSGNDSASDPDDDDGPSNSGNGGSSSGNTSGGNGGGSGEIEQVFIGTSVNDNAMGSVTGMGTYNKGESVTLIANANEGYRFVSWGDEVTDNPRTVTADVNGVTYSAIFEAI